MGTLPFHKLRVVVVDDNDHMRMLLHSMLSAFGVKTITSEPNGKSGFAVVQAVKPNLVLTDFAMQPVDGVELVKMIRALAGPLAMIPIIMVTGHGERHYIERARDAGVTEFLTKPVTARDLYLRIAEVIERPRPFVRSPSYVGPCRRRRVLTSGFEKRRKSDFADDLVTR